MDHSRRILVVGLSVSGFLLAGVPIATVAQAASSDCTTGRMCLWRNTNYTGTRLELNGDEANLDDYDFGDQASSGYNRDTVAWVIYDDANYQDTAVCFRKGASVGNLGAYGFGDKASSADRRGGDTCPTGVIVFYGPNREAEEAE